MPDLELAASDVADLRRSRPLTVFEAQGRTTLDLPRGQTVGKLAADVLPSYLIERRWYAAKDSAVPNVGIAIVDGADAFGFPAHSADSPNPRRDNGRDADRG